MEKRPLVSIITPTYNHEEFIGQCIESVLAQTYPHWEQIIIDDGSTDHTSEVIAEYNDKRIKYVRQDNIGIWRLAETYNKALHLSKGDLIAILEGDDFWPTYKLESQIPLFERKDVVLSFGLAAVTNRKSEPVCLIHKGFNMNSKEEFLKTLLIRNVIPACTVICRRDALLSMGGFKQPKNTPYVDHPTWLELFLRGEFSFVNVVLGYWRTHEKQTSSLLTKEMCYAHNKYVIDYYNRLPTRTKNSISLTLNELMRELLNKEAMLYFSLGRRDLFHHRWEHSREYFVEALHKGKFSTKLRAILGIVCSYSRFDLETIALLTRRPTLYKLY